jgi:predicted O-linked N-acetylglucosamine transferase (SPINDLY family)
MVAGQDDATFARLYHEAIAHHAAGSIAAASASLRRAAAMVPSRSEPLIGLGAIAAGASSARGALDFAKRALAVDAKATEALYNAALAWEALGALSRARLAYRHLLLLVPAFAAAHERLAGILMRVDVRAAATIYHRAVCCAPTELGIRTNLGHALRVTGEAGAALEEWRRIARLAPLDADVRINLGGLLAELGRGGEARTNLRQALTLSPQNAGGHYNLASIERSSGEAPRLERALAIDPTLAVANLDLGVLYQADGHLDRALTCYRYAAAVDPTLPAAQHNVAAVLLQQGWTDRAEAPFRRAAMLAGSASFHSDLLFYLCFKETPDRPAIFKDHVLFDRRFATSIHRLANPAFYDRSPERTLRVGYVSANFHRHPVGHCLLGLFQKHNRHHVEVHAYAGNIKADDMTASLRRAVDGWHPIQDLNDAELADRIRGDRIDILIDCIGHLPQGRLLTFARRPAPIQIGFPVYPNTSGCTALDYRITNIRVDPPDQDRFYTERLLRLPETHVVHAPSGDPQEPPEEPPSARRGYVTFASFNNPAKLGPLTLAAWADILGRVPTARLALKWKGLTSRSPPVRSLVEHGIAIDRIEIRDWSPTAYAPYLGVDCCLDPFVNGGNTSFDALWMGVPLVTLRGAHLFARTGTELLTQVGLDDLIADTIVAYVDAAVGLATDPVRLARARRGLRARLSGSPAMDADRYARHIEAAYREVWRRWCADLQTTAIEIAPIARA